MTGPTRTSPPWSRLRWPSLNGVCGGPDHVDHEGGLREHGHVAAVGLMDAGAHPLRDEALQLGMNGVVVLAHDVPGRLRPPGGAFHLLVEQIDGRHTLGCPDDLLLLLGEISREVSRSGDDARHSASDPGVPDPRAPHQQAPVQVVLAAQQMPSICRPARAIAACTSPCGNGSPIARQVRMPMIDVYAAADLFPADADRQLAEELTLALLKAEDVESPGPTHLNNTGAYIHRMPPSAVNTAAAGAARTVRAQVLAPPGVLQRAGQKQLVAEITRIVSKVSGDPTQAGRTWVLLTEAAEGGWGPAGTAFGKEEFAALAARAKAKP